ncbi:MAG: hypothetical protein FJ184_13275 [Gammaproteobacteria bacterium]|nr:hypothetical protein [Gammaproteobacteria bacterium]
MIRKLGLVFLAIAVIGRVEAHPTPVDDLVRPVVKVVSRSPLVLVVSVTPRQAVSSVSVETPNNLNGPLVQCAFGALVEGQKYECSVTGAAASSEASFAVNVNARVVGSDGHEHFSSRSLSVSNPSFDIEEFQAQRRRETAQTRSVGKTEPMPIRKK